MRHEGDHDASGPRGAPSGGARGGNVLRSSLFAVAVGCALVFALADGRWLRADPPAVHAAAVVVTPAAGVAAPEGPPPAAIAPPTCTIGA